mmetsp:Transcript_18708/g.37966  ORF Transcript_18708/g.37966 Transcript_18708/m.37966 type:complete len:265 (+) Transcript_18708:315-1109(+)
MPKVSTLLILPPASSLLSSFSSSSPPAPQTPRWKIPFRPPLPSLPPITPPSSSASPLPRNNLLTPTIEQLQAYRTGCVLELPLPSPCLLFPLLVELSPGLCVLPPPPLIPVLPPCHESERQCHEGHHGAEMPNKICRLFLETRRSAFQHGPYGAHGSDEVVAVRASAEVGSHGGDNAFKLPTAAAGEYKRSETDAGHRAAGQRPEGQRAAEQKRGSGRSGTNKAGQENGSSKGYGQQTQRARDGRGVVDRILSSFALSRWCWRT